MDIMFYFLIALVILLSALVYSVSSFKDQMFKEMFKKKDLPVINKIKIGKKGKLTIYLYGLKRNEKDEIDRNDETYIRIAKMVNKDLEIKTSGDDLIIEKPDYSDVAYNLKMMDVISLVTNFNYSQFVFRGEDKFKLYSAKTKFGDDLKEHAMNIIDEVFVDIVKRIEEGVAESLHK